MLFIQFFFFFEVLSFKYILNVNILLTSLKALYSTICFYCIIKYFQRSVFLCKQVGLVIKKNWLYQVLSFCNLLIFVTSLTMGKAGKRDKVGFIGCLSWGILGYFLLPVAGGHYKTSRHARAHLPQQVLWQSCWDFRQRGQGHGCFGLSCAAGVQPSPGPAELMQNQNAGGEALEVSSWGNTRCSLALTKHRVWAVTKILLIIRGHVNIIAAIFSTWWFRNWAENKVQTPQITFLSFVFARDGCPGSLGVFVYQLPPSPLFRYFRFTVKINGLGIWGGAPCLTQRRAHTQHIEGHLYGLVYLGFCLGSLCAAGAAEDRASCVLGTVAAALSLSLSPCWLHFPLEQLLPCLLCPECTVLFTFFPPCSLWNL